MFNFISRSVDYSLHSLLGFDIDKVPLAPFSLHEPSLSLISELYTTSTPVLGLSKIDNGIAEQSKTIEIVAQDVESLLYRNNYNIKVHPVKAHLIDGNLNEVISNNHLSTLNNKHVFLESPDTEIPHDLYDYVFSIQLKNLIPVINFPERNSHFTSKNQRLLKLKDRGCVFHIDLLSLTGYFGQEAKGIANSLLQTNEVHFVSFQIKNLEIIKKSNGIRVSRKVASLLDEQLFIG